MRKKITIMAVLVLCVVLFTFTASALEPPLSTYTTGAGGYLGSNPSPVLCTSTRKIDYDEAEQIMDIIDYQSRTGSFNNLQPIMVYIPPRDGSNDRYIYVLLSPLSNNAYYTYDATTMTFVRSAEVSLYRAVLSDRGFYEHVQVTAPTDIPEAQVVAYRSSNTAYNNIAINEEYFGLSNSGLSDTHQDRLTDAETAWRDYYNRLVNYESTLNAYLEQGKLIGYNNGYAAGEADGYAAGLAAGIEQGVTDGYTAGFADGELAGYELGYSEGYGLGNNLGYQTGYNNGYAAGEDDGYAEGEADGYTLGYDYGYSLGYNAGQAAGGSYQLDIGGIITSVPSAAKTIVNDALGFEIFGINVAGTLTAILILAIVICVVKWLLGKRG